MDIVFFVFFFLAACKKDDEVDISIRMDKRIAKMAKTLLQGYQRRFKVICEDCVN